MGGIGTTEIVLIIFVLVVLAMPLLVVGAIVAIKIIISKQKSKRKCPFCAELIQPEAVVCRFCGKDLNGQVK